MQPEGWIILEQTQENRALETAPLGKLMRQYSLPCVISLLVGALYNIVDQLFIANASYLGSYGNAANSVVFPLTIIALAIATMIGDGCCSYSSIALGNKNNRIANKSTGNSIILVLLVSVVLTAVYLIFAGPILRAFGGDVNARTFDLAKEYFFWISLGIPGYMFGQAMNPIIRSDGNPRFAMINLTVGAVINIILDPIFIFGTKWGMMGAALATIIGQYISAIMAAVYLRRMRTIHLDRDSFKMQWSLFGKTLPLGMTSFLSQFSNVLSLAAVLNMAKKYGAMDPVFGQEQYAQIPTAVIGIVMKFFQMIMAIAIGISAGLIPVVGYNVGAGRTDRVRGFMRRMVAVEAIVGLIATIIFEAIPGPLMNIFGAAHESIYYRQFAVRCIRIFLSMMIFACINKGTYIFLQALGKAGQSTLLSLTREIVFGVGLVLVLPLWLGLDGILYYMPLADILSMIISAIILLKTNRDLKEGKITGKTAQAAGAGSSFPVGDPLTDKIITIGRSYGAGGRDVGQEVAKELNIPYYDTELLALTARKSGLDEKYLSGIDEKKVPGHTIYAYTAESVKQEELISRAAYQAQAEIIEEVAEKGPCVIVGRRADQILKDSGKVFSVFVTASKETRCKRVMARDGLDESAAMKKINKVDHDRAAYYNLLSSKKLWGRLENYDLSFDLDRINVSQAVKTIVGAVRLEAPKAASQATAVSTKE